MAAAVIFFGKVIPKSIIISGITFIALLHLHISAKHSVDFLCRLFKITFVHAVVGADGCRYVLVTEQLLNDFRILSAFKQHTRIGMPQCVKMKAVLGKPRFAHQFVEHRARAVVSA